MESAPLVVFAFNRVDKLKRCIEALEKNDAHEETDLHIFVDGPRGEKDNEGVEKVREYLKEYEKISKFAKVKLYISEKNKGLACSLILGITDIIKIYGKVIVVEDDLIVSNFFLKYMNEMLAFYEKVAYIGAISGYTYPLNDLKNLHEDIYAMHKGDCWGWATWQDRWDDASWAEIDYREYYYNWKVRQRFEKVENNWDSIMCAQMNGKCDSWAIRWVYYLWKKEYLTIYPRISLVANDGFDGSGTHCKDEIKYKANIYNDIGEVRLIDNISANKRLEKQAAMYPRYNSFVYYLGRIKKRMELLLLKYRNKK